MLEDPIKMICACPYGIDGSIEIILKFSQLACCQKVALKRFYSAYIQSDYFTATAGINKNHQYQNNFVIN
jgi:hypothetical protein